jgi:hypothetical protein
MIEFGLPPEPSRVSAPQCGHAATARPGMTRDRLKPRVLPSVKQSDWIEATLVTVDVTGVWEGTVSGGGGAGATLPAAHALFDLEQEGPRVTGKFQTKGCHGPKLWSSRRA